VAEGRRNAARVLYEEPAALRSRQTSDLLRIVTASRGSALLHQLGLLAGVLVDINQLETPRRLLKPDACGHFGRTSRLTSAARRLIRVHMGLGLDQGKVQTTRALQIRSQRP
jgi:hypothetical protein